jgi:maltose alpha-D-glucosyltransferase/alpha-amylase
MANPSALYLPVILDPIYHYQAVNVEAQLASSTSLLNWVRRLIKVRREHKVFSRGSLEFVPSGNRRVVAYVRAYQDQIVLVVNSLSRFPQPVELDLSRYKGMTLTEINGNVSFPAVGEHPYLITLGPHGFYWFRLEAGI